MIKRAYPLFGLILTGCLFTKTIEPQSIPVPNESVEAQITVRFQQKEEAKDGQLFVCGWDAGEFWCLDYEVFNSQLKTYH